MTVRDLLSHQSGLSYGFFDPGTVMFQALNERGVHNPMTTLAQMVDVLADLHAVDPDAVGLTDLGKKDAYIERQLKTWYRSWNASIEGAQLDDPRAHALQAYFLAHTPEQGPARVVHGDYGLHNTLVGADGQIAAVVDWEISTLGDPLADLAYALNQWAEPGDPPPVRAVPPTSLPGFPSRAELADRFGNEAAFLMMAISGALAAMLAWFGLPETRHRAGGATVRAAGP